MEHKFYQTDKFKDIINWEVLMKLPRYAGGHDEQMKSLFKGSEVIAHYNEGDYQGYVATCVKLPSGEYAIYSDSYGSCSGCDVWECASDDEVRQMCVQLACGSLIFKTLEDVKEFLASPPDDAIFWEWRQEQGGLGEILLRYIREGRID